MTTQPRNFTTPNVLLGAEEARSVQGALFGFVALLLLAEGFSFWILLQTPILIFFGIEMLVMWAALSAAIHFLYAICERVQPAEVVSAKPKTYLGRVRQLGRFLTSQFATFTQWLVYLTGVISAASILWPGFNYLREPSQILPVNLRFAAIIFIAIAGILYLYSNYIAVLQTRLHAVILQSFIRLSRLVLTAYAVTAGILFVFLSSNYDVCWLGWILFGLAGILAVEPLLLAMGRYYQPKALRKTPSPIGASVILEFAYGSGTGAKAVLRDFEDLVGTKVGDVWILGFLKDAVEVVLVTGLLLGWLSTCVRTVPMANEGVLISFGRYQDETLKPGLHLLMPWPLQEIKLVETKRLHDVSLGFDKDLSGPLLWTEKHVEGEKNILVGGGESLLTVNVPIIYRISSPVTFLKNTTDAESALRYLAERKLIQIVGTRESFQIMTEDRAPITAALKKGVQDEVDRLGLGLEIVFVGLKDMHPPVDVAPAYENVVSAQEKKEALIDDALAYEAHVLPGARAQALALVIAAQAAYTNRVDVATGESTRFALILPSDKSNPDLLRLRLQYDALDETLAASTKTILGISPGSTPDCYLDLRAGGDNRVPGQMLTH